MDLKSLGIKLKEARIEKGLTPDALAKRLDLPTNYISAIESGQKEPSLLTFIKLANALNVSANFLLGMPPITTSGEYADTLNHFLNVSSPKEQQLLFDFIDYLYEREEK